MLLRNDTDTEQVLPTLNVGAQPGETVDVPIDDDDQIPVGWSKASTPAQTPPAADTASPAATSPNVDPAADTANPGPRGTAMGMDPDPVTAAGMATTENAVNDITTLNPAQEA